MVFRMYEQVIKNILPMIIQMETSVLSAMDAESVYVRINEVRPGSVKVDFVIAIQTKETPNVALDNLLQNLSSSLQPKYDIQELTPSRGNNQPLLHVELFCLYLICMILDRISQWKTMS